MKNIVKNIILVVLLALAAGCATVEPGQERTVENNSFIIDCRGEKPRYISQEEMGKSIKLLGADTPGGLL